MTAAESGARRWQPFGLRDSDLDGADQRGVKVVNLRLTGGGGSPDRAGGWLRGALIALAVLATAAAAASWDAQYVMVAAARHNPAIAALEAAIPDVGAIIFASLGIALALHEKRALRPRALNVGCVAISLTMNTLAAGHGWRDLAIWVMPSAVYALASDTLIGVIRAWAVARKDHRGETLADDGSTPLALAAAAALWLLRLSLAPASTLRGFRTWVIEECPIAPGRTASTSLPPAPAVAELPPARSHRSRPGKQDRLIALASQRHDLRSVPLGQVSQIANQIGAEVDLHQGTARRVLRAHVRDLQNPAPTSQEDES
jgi:hypothetical protein